MTLRMYSIAELLAAAKAVIRAGISSVGSESGTDFDLTLNAAARLLQGTQVAGAAIYEQLDPQTADAQRRDQLVDQLGLVFARDATPARGLICLTLDPETSVGGYRVVAGTEVTFPGELFVDGEERVYRLLEDAVVGSYYLTSDYQLSAGSGIRKLLPKDADGISALPARTTMTVKTDAGTFTQFAVVRSSNSADQSVDLYVPLMGSMTAASTNRIYKSVTNCIVAAECVTAGAAGNCGPVRYDDTEDATATVPPEAPANGTLIAMILEMGGGGDEVGDIDGDTERVTRLIEDTIAMPPSFGNAQHWREIVLSCPDVDLDDAVVYQHVRGTGTVDIVCIGRSGSIRSSAYPDANLSFVFWGNNARRIGDVQVAKLQAWVNSKAAYFDDILVRSVEWDWRGHTYEDSSFLAFIMASSSMVVRTVPQDGFGPDCGVVLDIVPSTRHATKLYPVSLGTIDDSLQVGHRVWATVGHSTSDTRHSFATVVTTILSIDGAREFATIADVADLGPGVDALDGGTLQVLRWGSAGPLTQPVLDAVFAYYDKLGPGSYTETPKGPYYMAHYQTGVAPPLPGTGVLRWPPEGRRWNSSLRTTELRAAIMAIEGVRSCSIAPVGAPTGLIDFEPTVFQTLALTGCVPLYSEP